MLAQVAAVAARHQQIAALFDEAIGTASPEAVTHPTGERWSAREILIHLGNCAEACADDIAGQLSGQPLRRDFLPPDDWNEQQLARYAHLDGSGALAYYHEMRQRLDATAEGITEKDPFCLGIYQMTLEHEVGHRHQLLEALAAARGDTKAALLHFMDYTRYQVLAALSLDSRPQATLCWQPPDGKWSAAGHAIHLAVWDRHVAAGLAAKAEGRPEPPDLFEEGGLDRFNQESVAARSWQSLGAVLHELGAARGDLAAQIARLSPQLFAAEASGLRRYAFHDLHHAMLIRRLLRQAPKA